MKLLRRNGVRPDSVYELAAREISCGELKHHPLSFIHGRAQFVLYMRLIADDEAVTVEALNANLVAMSIGSNHGRASPVIFRFGDCEIDSGRYELRRAGTPVPIEPKVLDLLLHLVRERHHLVTKQELLDAVWPGVHVTEGTLTRAVSLARTAVGDSAQAHAVVETVSGRGYRWKAPIDVVDREGGEGHAARAIPGVSDRPVIAVLPFDNLSGDPEQKYFADGLAEDLIARLSRSRSFSVISRASSFVFRGRGIDLAQVGRVLGVRYVVLGSVRRAGGRVRVNAHLAETRTGLEIWADRYDHELGEIFAAQDELTRAIVSAVVPRVRGIEQDRALGRDPSDIDAWDAVLRGTWHLFRYTRDDLAEAEALLRRATELDPHLVSAWANLANCLFVQLYYGWTADAAARMDEAMHVARRAVAVDAADPTAQFALAWGYLFRGDHEAARVAGERAAELNPSLSAAHWVLGVALTGLGRADDGAAAIQEAIRLSPRDPSMRFYRQNLGIAHLMACRYEEAAECARRALALGPDQAAPHRLLAACHGHLGRVEEARDAFCEAMRLEPGFSLDELRRINHPAIVEQLLGGWRKGGVDSQLLSEG